MGNRLKSCQHHWLLEGPGLPEEWPGSLPPKEHNIRSYCIRCQEEKYMPLVIPISPYEDFLETEEEKAKKGGPGL